MPLSNDAIETLRTSVAPGNRVAIAIRLANLTQAEVADGTGLPQPYVSDVARNRYSTITVENAHRFSAFFGASIEVLFPSQEEVA